MLIRRHMLMLDMPLLIAPPAYSRDMPYARCCDAILMLLLMPPSFSCHDYAPPSPPMPLRCYAAMMMLRERQYAYFFLRVADYADAAATAMIDDADAATRRRHADTAPCAAIMPP